MTTNDARPRILFLCTGNSARSLIAEAVINDLFDEHLIAVSAGAAPTGEPKPLALQTLRQHDINCDGLRSKSWEEFKDVHIDVVITLCSDAASRPCPTFPGAPAVVHWGMPDPPEADDPAAAFQSVYQTVLEAATTMLSTPGDDIVAKARAGAEVPARYYPDSQIAD